MKLKTYPPGSFNKQDKPVKLELTCWSCQGMFTELISAGNLGQCIFVCPTCHQRVEIT